jgi:hypothetical protein
MMSSTPGAQASPSPEGRRAGGRRTRRDADGSSPDCVRSSIGRPLASTWFCVQGCLGQHQEPKVHRGPVARADDRVPGRPRPDPHPLIAGPWPTPMGGVVVMRQRLCSATQALLTMSINVRWARQPSSRSILSIRPTMRAGSPGRRSTASWHRGRPVAARTASITSRTLLPTPRPTLYVDTRLSVSRTPAARTCALARSRTPT